ncbi:MAG TPA: twin-arginine translocase TatA/TatE family subunit [Acidobacteriaceae bacterium]|nr:twin-arginine translocase TatA/TatE family subunit [Acidobacteriaceae bacterium]
MGATPHIYAASIGIQDSVFLMFLALVIFGPRRLPEIGRQIGKLMYEFRKVSNDFKFQMEEELRAAEEADRQRKLQASLPPPVAETPASEAAAETVADAQPSTASAEPESSEKPNEPASSAPQIQPPSTGEPVAAARPFRASQPAEPEASVQETVADSGSEPAQESHAESPAESDSEVISPLAYGSDGQSGVSAETHHG